MALSIFHPPIIPFSGRDFTPFKLSTWEFVSHAVIIDENCYIIGTFFLSNFENYKIIGRLYLHAYLLPSGEIPATPQTSPISPAHVWK